MGLNQDDIKALIAILQKGLVDDNDDVIEETSQPKLVKKKRSQNRIIKTTKKAKKTKKSINKFNSMAEMNMHKEDCAFDRKVLKNDPVPRRSTFIPVSARCRVCGKSEKVDPSLVESIDRYKCNKCSSSAG